MTLSDLLSRLDGVRSSGKDQFLARCPAHKDQHQSLSISAGESGRLLLHCHAGCSVQSITAALGLSVSDLFAEQAEFFSEKEFRNPYNSASVFYTYTDPETGRPVARKVRYGDKRFFWQHPDGSGGWANGRAGVPFLLYTPGGRPGQAVYLCEGEKDADTLWRLGLESACSMDGAGPGKWREHPEYTRQMAGREVWVFADNDAVGLAFAAEVCGALHGVAKRVGLVDLRSVWPEIPEHGDLSDLVARFGEEQGRKLLNRAAAQAPEWDFGGSEGRDEPERPEKSGAEFAPLRPFEEPGKEELPEFPVQELTKPALINFTMLTADSLQTSPGLTAVAVLAAAAVCAQGRFRVCVRPGWSEPVNLYCAVVAKPSERKSPTLAQVMEPVYLYQKAENARRAPEISAYRDRKALLEKSIESIMKASTGPKKAKSGDACAMDRIGALRRELAELEEHAVRPLCLTADDITMEALVSKMAANGGRMALVSSEGGIFNVLSGLYTGGIVNTDVLLKAWSGDHLSVDRKCREPEELEHPALTILLMIQPKVLEGVMRNPEFFGRGLNARFLYALPASLVGRRRFDIPEGYAEVYGSVRDEYRALLQRILSRPEQTCDLVLSAAALEVLRGLHNEIEPRLAGDLAPMGDWAGKYVGTVVRIAGLLHVCDDPERASGLPVPAETMRRAARIGDFFLQHARAAYRLGGAFETPAVRDAKYILSKLARSETGSMTKRELYQRCRDRAGMETVSGMEAGLRELLERGYIKIEKQPAGASLKTPNAGRPGERIVLNPSARCCQAGGKP